MLLCAAPLIVAAPKPLVWTGAANSSWDLTSLDWNVNGLGRLFAGGDGVQFDDNFTGPSAISILAAGVAPSAVTFSHQSGSTATNYVFTSSGLTGIAGTASLTTDVGFLGSVDLNLVNTYTGGTTINGGTVIVHTASSLGAITGGLTINSGTLRVANSFSTTRALSLGSTSSTIQVDSNQTYTVSSAISGLGVLNKTGSGRLVLSVANNYTGGTVINSGTVSVVASALGSGALTINAGTLEVSGNITTTRDITLGTSSSTFQIDPAVTYTVNTTPIHGSGALNKAGTGTMVLGAANTYTGLTSVNAGTLQVNVDGALGAVGNGTTVASGAALKLNGINYSVAEALTLNGSGIANGGALVNVGTSTFAGQITAATNATINAGGGTLNLTGGLVKNGTVLTLAGGGRINITGTGISGSMANSDLVVDGTTVVLGASSSYNGPTTIQNSGTLQLGANNVLPASPQTAMTVNASSNLDMASYSDGVASLSGDSTGVVKNSVTGTTSTLTVNPASATSTTFAGVIAGTNSAAQGNISLVKSGSGTLVLTGANTFSGSTTVNGGTLTLATSSGSALGSTSSIAVNSGGTLALGASNQINDSASMTLAGGTFAKGNYSEGSSAAPGIGALTLTAAGSHVDFGTGTVGTLAFASFTPNAFKLTIDNWTGTVNTIGSSTTDRLIFASDQSANLGSFSFTGFNGATEFSLGNGMWEVTPLTAVPEPATWLAAGCAVLAISSHLLRRVARRRAIVAPCVGRGSSFVR